MTILLDIRQPAWMSEEQLRDQLAPHLPGVTIHCHPTDAPLDDVEMLVCVGLHDGVAASLPGLRLVQKLGAGVDAIVADPDLAPEVQVTRLKPDAPAREIAEFCLAYVLREQRNMRFHEAHAEKAEWVQVPPSITPETTIGVLGLGHIGARTARLFAHLEFRVIGWSRTPKTIDGVDCRAGEDALPDLLAECDHVCSILPSTPLTRGLFDAAMLAKMKPGAVLINAGRGDLVVEPDLLKALDTGTPGHAVLDVVSEEPLPTDNPLWHHDGVTITPHVSGWHVDDSFGIIVENYRRLIAGEPLLHLVDRTAGY